MCSVDRNPSGGIAPPGRPVRSLQGAAQGAAPLSHTTGGRTCPPQHPQSQPRKMKQSGGHRARCMRAHTHTHKHLLPSTTPARSSRTCLPQHLDHGLKDDVVGGAPRALHARKRLQRAPPLRAPAVRGDEGGVGHHVCRGATVFRAEFMVGLMRPSKDGAFAVRCGAVWWWCARCLIHRACVKQGVGML